MKPGEIIAYCILGILVVLTMVSLNGQSMQTKAINDRLGALEARMTDRTIPRISIDRASVYAGSGEITVETLEGDCGNSSPQWEGK